MPIDTDNSFQRRLARLRARQSGPSRLGRRYRQRWREDALHYTCPQATFSKVGEWFIDELGNMTRLIGDIDSVGRD